jgi:putative tricarboxylic transport membrane protein
MNHLTFEILLDFLHFKYLFYVALGTISGIVVGVVPGLTVTMATAILVSFTYGWPVYDALALMMGIYVGGVYGGGQTAILVNIPGAPAAIATTLDGFPLAQRGEGGPAIALLTTQSFLGGIIGILFLGFTAPAITSFALKFASPEYFLLGLFGITMMGRMGSDSLVIGLLSGLFGVWLSMIGIDPIYGVVDRYTFGLVDLSGGVPIIPALIGMFGLSEVLFQQKKVKIKPVILKVTNILPKFWQIERY